jgi:hypothetical protein
MGSRRIKTMLRIKIKSLEHGCFAPRVLANTAKAAEANFSLGFQPRTL